MKIICNISKELFEKLAELEHQRWSDWQSYLHSKCQLCPDGSLLIPSGYVKHLTRQINTNYNNLTEKEKDSDRIEVERYLKILTDNTIPETKQTVIDVKKCEKCIFFYWDSDKDSCCNYYSKQLSWNLAKPDYCKVTKIIVEENK